MRHPLPAVTASPLAAAAPAQDRPPVDHRIDERTDRSRVMPTARHLADMLGPGRPTRPPVPTRPVVTDPFACSTDDG